MPEPKVMIIGIDAATLELVQRWAGEGRLPNLKRFLDQGAHGLLRSTIPPHSPAAWSTFATGKNPGRHGILNFIQATPENYAPTFVNASRRRGRTFWEIAGDAGIRGGILNVPITFPPRAFNGFLVAGMLSPGASREMVTPPEVWDDLQDSSPDYEPEIEYAHSPLRGKDLRLVYAERVLDVLEQRRRAAIGLYRKHRPPLYCAVFVAPDRICHYAWGYMQAQAAGKKLDETEAQFAGMIREVYERVDAAVGELLAEAGDDTDVLILSDHGAGSQTQALNLTQALAEAGLLTPRQAPRTQRIANRMLWAFERVCPWKLQCRIKASLPGLSRRAAGAIVASGIDFARTRAYPAGPVGGVFVNLQGRQPQGIVPPEEYEQARDEIIASLQALRDPETQQPVARKVYRREELWSGPMLEQLPDVIFEQVDETYHIPTATERPPEKVIYPIPPCTSQKLHRSGGHRLDGIVMGLGPHIRHAKVEGATLADVPATALALLGCKIPEDFDGRVLEEMLTDDVELPGRSSESGSSADKDKAVYSAEDEATIEQRLRGLGYL